MSVGSIIEVAVAAALIATAVVLYRRRSRAQAYGSQSAVLLLAIGVIMLIHGLGGLEYRPAAGELAR